MFSSGWAQAEISVVWHAGEQMVLPVAFYRDAFALIDASISVVILAMAGMATGRANVND